MRIYEGIGIIILVVLLAWLSYWIFVIKLGMPIWAWLIIGG